MPAVGQRCTGGVAQGSQDRLFGKEVGAIQTSVEALCRVKGWLGGFPSLAELIPGAPKTFGKQAAAHSGGEGCGAGCRAGCGVHPTGKDSLAPKHQPKLFPGSSPPSQRCATHVCTGRAGGVAESQLNNSRGAIIIKAKQAGAGERRCLPAK